MNRYFTAVHTTDQVLVNSQKTRLAEAEHVLLSRPIRIVKSYEVTTPALSFFLSLASCRSSVLVIVHSSYLSFVAGNALILGKFQFSTRILI